MNSVVRLMEGKLKLIVNREKSAVDRPWKRKFLGLSYLPDAKATIRLAPKTLDRFKEKIRTHCSRLDEWIRRRLRMCLWKQWKTPKTRLEKLRALGTGMGSQTNGWFPAWAMGNGPQYEQSP